MNVENMVVMTCQTFHTSVQQSEAMYKRQMMGAGSYYRSRQRERVRCPKYIVDLVSGSPDAHRQNQHGFGQGHNWAEKPPPEYPQMYQVLFP